MGVVRPPWVSKEWFSKCPFNYCDHFGNQEVLASVCKICKDDVQRKRLYKKAGKDPNDPEYAFKDIADNLAKVFKMVEKDAKRLGIDLNNLPEEEKLAPKPETYPFFLLIQRYTKQIVTIINILHKISLIIPNELTLKTIETLAHSHGFVIVKIARAYESQYEEHHDQSLKELADSKTSAFLAYMAVERNSRALLALSHERFPQDIQEILLEVAAISIEIAQLVQRIFFPDEQLIYQEFGCEEYDELFNDV